MRKKTHKVAIAHDWLVAYAGAEIVLENILKLFEHSDLFCIIRDSKNPIFYCDSIDMFTVALYKEFHLSQKTTNFLLVLCRRKSKNLT